MIKIAKLKFIKKKKVKKKKEQDEVKLVLDG
jgi:hypothetical protein